MSRLAHDGAILGPLVIGLGRTGVGAPLAERSVTWGNGVLHDSLVFRLTPWRWNWRYLYALPGPSLVIGWRR